MQRPSRHARALAALLVLPSTLLMAGAASAQTLTSSELALAEQQIREGTPEQRALAADRFGQRGASHRDRVVPHLRERLREDRDWRVRASAARAIGRLAARDAVPDLVRALRDPVVDVRVVAAAAIWRLPDPAAVPPLLELLRDQDASARQWAVLALGVIRDRRSTRPLLTLLRDPEHEVRLDAIRSLGRLRDPTATRPLEAFIRDTSHDTEERLEAVSALSALDGPDKVNALVRLLRFEQETIRERVAQSLGRVGDALVLPPLRERRRAERSSDVRAAIDAAIEEIQARGREGSHAAGTGVPLNLPPLPE